MKEGEIILTEVSIRIAESNVWTNRKALGAQFMDGMARVWYEGIHTHEEVLRPGKVKYLTPSPISGQNETEVTYPETHVLILGNI